MYIAMNRFQVKRGAEDRFEEVWANRETRLAGVPGFVAFKLLRGPAEETYTLYASHTLWESRAAFQAWVNSEAFRQAHASAGAHKDMYLGPPQFEGFEVVQAES